MAIHRYKMYRTGKEWKELGIIGDRLQFTDDEIITTQGIGYTMTKMQYGEYPMDAAVMFSLLSAGPEARLNTQDLVNLQTRTAARFEQRMVAKMATVNEAAPSCGHDEISHKFRYRFPRIQKQYKYSYHLPAGLSAVDKKIIEQYYSQYSYLTSNGGGLTREGVKKQFSYKLKVSDKIDALCDEYPQLFKSYDEIKDMPMDDFYTFYEKVRNIAVAHNKVKNQQVMLPKEFAKQWLTTKALKVYFTMNKGMSPNTSTSKFHSVWTNGNCGWTNGKKEINGKTVLCGHHHAKPVYRWVYVEGQDLYQNTRVSQITKSQTPMNKIIKVSTKPNHLLWDEHARSIVQKVPDKTVRKLVSKSLSRLSKKGLIVRFGEGRERSFTWRHWKWLDDMQHRILQVNAKKRKVGDEVNGWRYSKANIRESYGMELCDYVWVPIQELKTYHIKYQTWKKDTWYKNNINSHANTLTGIFFGDKGKAQQFANQMNAVFKANDLNYTCTKTNSTTGEKENYAEMVVYANEKVFKLKGEMHPEDYMSPAQIFHMWMNAAPDVWETKAQEFYTSPKQIITKVKYTPTKKTVTA